MLHFQIFCYTQDILTLTPTTTLTQFILYTMVDIWALYYFWYYFWCSWKIGNTLCQVCVQEQEWGEGRQTKAASLFHVQGNRIPLYNRASERHKGSICIQGNCLLFFPLQKWKQEKLVYFKATTYPTRTEEFALPPRAVSMENLCRQVLTGFRVFPACSSQIIPEENNRRPPFFFFLHWLIGRTSKWPWSFPSFQRQ